MLPDAALYFGRRCIDLIGWIDVITIIPFNWQRLTVQSAVDLPAVHNDDIILQQRDGSIGFFIDD